MRLATLINSSDGLNLSTSRLVLVRSCGTKYIPSAYPSLLDALKEWSSASPALLKGAEKLETSSDPDIRELDLDLCLAPLPNAPALLDGSAFLHHVRLARKARGAEPPVDLEKTPLMYRGASDCLGAPRSSLSSIPEWGLDFEGEFAVVTGDVPRGVSVANAESSIRLILLMNDTSLRSLIPREVGTGFGFVQGKPGASFAPFAVTPDELGNKWKDSRAHLSLTVSLNGQAFGSPSAGAMHFSFAELIAHAAHTRPLSAGTIIGSGTVSDGQEANGFACIVEKRMTEKILLGAEQTNYLIEGDLVEMEVLDRGRSLFGKISHLVTK